MLSKALSIKIGCYASQWLENVDIQTYAKFDQNIPCGSRVISIFMTDRQTHIVIKWTPVGRGIVFDVKSILFPVFTLSCELRLSENHTLKDYEMSGELYSQKSVWINHSNERNLYISIHSVVHV